MVWCPAQCFYHRQRQLFHSGISPLLRQKDYWQFVKDIRWLSPGSAHHLEKFISLQESGQCDPEASGDKAIAQLWLQHSLQCHCLSAQLRPLLGNHQYIRKFYADTAFLLSDAHVTAMLQCLEAVEQNNPRLLAQIDTSMLARKSDNPSPVTKSQSLTALPASPCVPAATCTQQRCFGSFSSLHQPQERCLSTRSSSFSEGRSPLEQSGSVTRFHVPSSKDPFSPASEMSSSTTSQSEDTWTGSQDDPQSDVNDGPEYLAIGNLGRRGRTCSSASTSSTKSSSSKIFSSSSSQKLDSVSSLGEQGASGGSSRGLSLLRRSSFSEGQSSAPQGILKKSHMRSHSDTNVTSGKLHVCLCFLSLNAALLLLCLSRRPQGYHHYNRRSSGRFGSQCNSPSLVIITSSSGLPLNHQCSFRKPEKKLSLLCPS
uniref:Rubicon autophagy regulator n=1 Tax=Malurus cyaneus samueli TaxID=2593467 RepID=A0A8C5U2D5_9PASS